MTPDEAAEMLRLRNELQEARAANSGPVGAIDAEIAGLKREKALQMAEGRFEESAQTDELLADAAARRVLAQQQAAWQQQRAAAAAQNPVEGYIAAHPELQHPRDVDWVRRWPAYAQNPQFQRRIIAAHDAALADGIPHRSDRYYAYLDRAAAPLYGREAHDNDPWTTANEREVGISTYRAAHPSYDTTNEDEVRKWWNRAKHSDAAYRMRENEQGW